MKTILFTICTSFIALLSNCNHKEQNETSDAIKRDLEENTEATEDIKNREKLSPKLFND